MASQELNKSSYHTASFKEVQNAEHARINTHRDASDRAKLPAMVPENGPVDVNGLALSGGGIRSAAFCLGVLQALDSEIGIEKIDYLSTVSGGGYIGLSLSVGMNAMADSQGGMGKRFPFSTDKNDKSDNQSVGHIRNYSRYLIPDGIKDIIASLTVVLRGLSTNIAMVFAVILLVSAITLFFNPNLLVETASTEPLYKTWLSYFMWTKICLVAGIALQVVWALWRSIRGGGAEFVGNFFKFSQIWLVLTAFIAFCELQPFALNGLHLAATNSTDAKGLIGSIANYTSQLAPFLASLAAVVAFASKYFGDAIKTQTSQKGLVSFTKWFTSKAILALAALALPITIWVIYLNVTLAGYEKFEDWPTWLSQTIDLVCNKSPSTVLRSWCTGVASALPHPLILIYFGAGLLLLAICYKFLTPNANSLHRLYRDRLSKAFLFDPKPVAKQHLNEHGPNDPPQLDTVKLSTLKAKYAPVHISNAALNIQGSDFANRRGRDADFFFFSQEYSGSSATGFIKTKDLERAVPELDVATIMAISGAAASSNMGSNTVWGFAPTLALLNIRLGFWMKNPNSITLHDNEVKDTDPRKLNALRTSYLLKEMFSKLNETDDQIYLTDGGHIENLGLYELLRRRCKRIIVVDAEADPNLSFRSLIDAERYARIDLGIRIELPWQAIRNASLAMNDVFASGKGPPRENSSNQPHVAIGCIDYGTEEKGILIYIKSSLTGDENDYVLDYKSRFSAFPHETTSDQFFSEEQFEVYRALGFHASHGAFDGKAYVEGTELLPHGSLPASSSPSTETIKDSDPHRVPLKNLFP